MTISPQLRRWLAIGSGIGIEVDGQDLVVCAVRLRFDRVRLLGECRIQNFAARPAAAWGAEYAEFTSRMGVSHLAANLLLPRDEATVRVVSLPPLKPAELDAALSFQMDSLHPYAEDEEIAHAWTQLERRGEILVALTPAATVQRYATLFAEANVQLASLSVAPAAVYSAIRLLGAPPAGDFAALEVGSGSVEIYGESAAKSLYSASLNAAPGRAAAFARSELRLLPEQVVGGFADLLPAPEAPRVAERVGELNAPLERPNSRAYAAALCAACPWLAVHVNLLPREARRSNSRLLFVPTVVLALALVVCAVALAAENSWEQRQYLTKLKAEAAQLEAPAARSQWLERNILKARGQTQQVDQFRSRSKADLDAMNELTKVLPPPAWVSTFDLNRTSVTLIGETPAAAGLLKSLDASPMFGGSTFLSGIVRSASGNDSFHIRAARKQVMP